MAAVGVVEVEQETVGGIALDDGRLNRCGKRKVELIADALGDVAIGEVGLGGESLEVDDGVGCTIARREGGGESDDSEDGEVDEGEESGVGVELGDGRAHVRISVACRNERLRGGTGGVPGRSGA